MTSQAQKPMNNVVAGVLLISVVGGAVGVLWQGSNVQSEFAALRNDVIPVVAKIEERVANMALQLTGISASIRNSVTAREVDAALRASILEHEAKGAHGSASARFIAIEKELDELKREMKELREKR